MLWKFQDDRPIWMQLTEQLTACILSGQYPLGSRLPTVRELATQAGVNPNTAQRALSQLETDHMAESERGNGRTVTLQTDVICGKRAQVAQGIAQTYLQHMENLGYTTAQAVDFLSPTTTTQGGVYYE